MRGIILVAGLGTRMLPATKVINKNLLPIFNRPMVLYSIDFLKENFDVKEILLISNARDIGDFANLLKDGSEYNISISYKVQNVQNGIATAIALAQDFIPKKEKFVVMFGDNIFLNSSSKKLKIAKDNKATIFVHEVKDPKRFGIVVFDKNKKPILIEEKPENPKSNSAVTGLLVYPYEAFEVIKTLKPSARGEYEATDLSNYFLKKKLCNVIPISSFCDNWIDVGTPEALLEVNNHSFNKQKI